MHTVEHSHILKLQRAAEHLLEFHEAALRWFNEGRHHQSFFETDPGDFRYLVLKASADPVPMKPFSVLASDAIHNMRSALDSLVFSLAVAFYRPNNVPDGIAERSQFLIVGDEDRKGNGGKGPAMFKQQAHKISGIDQQAQVIIQSIQPYKLGAKFRSHPLWWLAELSNIDKHRLLHTCAACFTTTFYPTPEFRANGPLLLPDTIIESETVLGRFEITTFPVGNPKMKVDVGIPFNLAFADGRYAKAGIYATLATISTFIVDQVLPQLEPFL